MVDPGVRCLRTREPMVAPGFLGVGWSPAEERARRRGERCPRCGTVAGREASGIPEHLFCLACLAFHPATAALLPFARPAPAAGGRADHLPPPRLTKAERKVVGANVHGRIWLAFQDAERAGDRARAARCRLWLALYRDRDLDADELARRAEEEGL